MAKGRKRRPGKPPGNQFRGPREETVVQRRPETEQDRDALAAGMERAAGGTRPGEIPAAFRRQPPGTAPRRPGPRPEDRELVDEVAAEVRAGALPAGLRPARPEDIHPSFAGLSETDEVPLIFTMPGDDHVPEGAGDFLGILDATATLADGTQIGPGAGVWLRAGYDPQAGLGEQTTVRFSDVSPALRAARRARGQQWSGTARLELDRPAAGTGKNTTSSQGGVDRSKLHPSLRDLLDDSEIRVVMVAEGGIPPPGRAGELLGTLDRPYVMTDGEIVPAGASVFRDLAPDESHLPALLPDGILRESPGQGQPGLDVPWAQGMSVTSAPYRSAGVRPGTPVHDSRFSSAKARTRMEVTSTAGGVPDWFTPLVAEPPVTHFMRGGDVLDIHAALAEAHMHPSELLLDFYDTYVTSLLDRAGEAAGDWGKVNRWASTFWPAQGAAEWCGVISRQLRSARTYEVTPPLVDAVHELYEDIVAQRVAYLSHDDLPWPSGFIYLDKPAAFTDPHGHTIYDRAFSWDVVYLPYPGRKVPGVRIISWSHPYDKDSYWSQDTATAIERTGGLGLGNVMLIPFGERIDALDYEGKRQDSVALFMRCLWFTLESVIGTTRTVPRADIGRGSIRRASRSLDHTDVNIVLLRRAITMAPEPAGDGHRSTRWTCRWFVDEFWRHSRRDAAWEAANEQHDERGRVVRHHAVPDHTRERCALCGARVVHVNTFDKGPAGLPYKKARQLYKLAR